MSCYFEKRVATEHVKARETHKAIEVNCPGCNNLPICLWCCLNFESLANPSTRLSAQDTHPDYYYDIPKLIGKTWDEFWESCNVCKVKSG